MGKDGEPFTSQVVETSSCRIYYRFAEGPSRADATPVVLVHGYGGSGQYLLPTARHLAVHYSIYVPDLPGYGNSAHPRRKPNAPMLAELLAEWMHTIGLQQASLVGNSFGCQIIAHLAARYPEMVSSLVLTSPTLDPRARPLPALFWRFISDVPREPISLIPIISRSFLASGPAMLLATLRSMREDDILAVLASVRAPGLVICGASDPLAPPDWCRQLAALLPNGDLVVIEDCAHALPFSQPDKLAHVIRSFVRGAGGEDGLHEASIMST
jgi:2-hydroxy-6-oxonona-2,4-dienedioate hydrolase